MPRRHKGLDWQGDRVKRAMAEGLLESLERAGAIGETLVARAVSRPQPRKVVRGRPRGLDPSRPGEPPKLVTGRLRASIAHRVETQGDSRVVAVVGSSVEYAPWLELGTAKMPPRPYLVPTLVGNAQRIAATLGSALRDAILRRVGGRSR